ncbi:MAG: hypothetical protein JWS12_205 [Candidatus Saccharibacteria bacterium]|nr:hypothetical protein [Candidatus Saccharibacteria bacterium]
MTRNRIKMILSASLLAPLLFIGSAAALESSTNPNTGSSDASHTPVVPPTTDKKTLDQRIAERETQFKTTLQVTEKARIELKCTGAQTFLKTIDTRAGEIETNRTKAYSGLQSKLTDLVAKLKAQNIDTTKLESELTALKIKVTTFNTDLAAYKQALNDLSTMSCKTNPTGFKASLESARAARVKVADDAAAIHGYVKDTIKPTLTDVRKALEDKKAAEGSNQ